MVTWVVSNVASLGGCSLTVSPRILGERLLQTQQLSLDPRLLSLRIETLGGSDGGGGTGTDNDDVVIAAKVLSGQVKGVVVFKHHAADALPDVELLARACDGGNIPLALNGATADLCLRGVARTRSCLPDPSRDT